MKYFTKEWYETCQKTSFHLSLEEDKRAEIFSEEYFQLLYKQKLKECLTLQQAFYAADREEAKNRFRPREPFDKQKTSDQFHEILLHNQERIEKTLPEAILKMIADIRVFGLDKASREVITAVTQFCEGNRRTVNRSIEQYQSYLKDVSNPLRRNIHEHPNFHDCKITGIKRSEHSLLILLDSGGFTDIKEVLLEHYKIIKQDSSLENSWWLYDEIYEVDGRNEWHILLQNENGELADFIITAEKISFRK